jgi:cytochrome bd ubiquinol oxidase subunit II
MLETLVAAVMLASLIVYALMGGADYGGGMWDLLASGARAQRQRQAIVEAIAPVWEANHVWLILVVVLLFSAFPRAFSTIMIGLHIPITAMLLGIVLRGSAFVFRKYDSTVELMSYHHNGRTKTISQPQNKIVKSPRVNWIQTGRRLVEK